VPSRAGDIYEGRRGWGMGMESGKGGVRTHTAVREDNDMGYVASHRWVRETPVGPLFEPHS